MTSEVKMPVVAWRNPTERSLADAFEWDIPRRSPAYSEALVKESDALAAIEAARVEARAKAMEDFRVACDGLEEPAYYGYENPNTWQDGKRACMDAIEALAKEAPIRAAASGDREGESR